MIAMPEVSEKRRKTAQIVSWVLVVAWAGFIFLMSANTGDNLNDGDGIVSKIYQALLALELQVFGTEAQIVPTAAHMTEFAVFGALLYAALQWQVPHAKPISAAVLLAVAIGSAYGITDEIHQIFVAGRFPDVFDWITDTIGVFVGALLMSLILKRAMRKSA